MQCTYDLTELTIVYIAILCVVHVVLAVHTGFNRIDCCLHCYIIAYIKYMPKKVNYITQKLLIFVKE